MTLASAALRKGTTSRRAKIWIERSAHKFEWLYFKRGAQLGVEYYTPSLLPPSNSRRQASAFRKGRAAHLLCSGVRKRRIAAVVGRALSIFAVQYIPRHASLSVHPGKVLRVHRLKGEGESGLPMLSVRTAARSRSDLGTSGLKMPSTVSGAMQWTAADAELNAPQRAYQAIAAVDPPSEPG